MPITFIRDLYTNVLSIINAHNEQSNLSKELSDLSKGENWLKKFFRNFGISPEARENVLNSFKSNLFPIEKSISEPGSNLSVFNTSKQTRAQSKIPKIEISLFKLNENVVIKNDEESIKSEIFREYFWDQNPSVLAKGLLKAIQVKNNTDQQKKKKKKKFA